MSVRSWLVTVSILALLFGPASSALGDPITYEGTLSPGVPFSGVNTQVPGSQIDPIGANYIAFFATAGSTVTIFGDRQAGHYDMAFWIFQGLFTDTTQFSGSFDPLDPGFIGFGDDEDPPNIPGPFGDPRVVFTAPVTGFYTVAVTNFASSAGPPNPFTVTGLNIQAAVIPEPGTCVLFSVAVSSIVAWLGCRRRSRSLHA